MFDGEVPHGGRLLAASRLHGIRLEAWLDLSTGVSPWPYPASGVPEASWARLPEVDDALLAAARRHLGTPAVLPVAGTQAAIRALPRLRRPSTVAVPHPGYGEHPEAWRRAGHLVIPLPPHHLPDGVDVAVVVNPNNPTGHHHSPDVLLDLADCLARRGGWLVVDEAFTDPLDRSLSGAGPRPGLVVLRSLGKFFGLPGARVGFVAAEEPLLRALAAELGPWTVAGPSRALAATALGDAAWQERQRRRHAAAATRLGELLSRHGLEPAGGTDLFRWVVTDRAAELADGLARRAILVRSFDDPPSLRFGLPADEAAWDRLDRALGEL